MTWRMTDIISAYTMRWLVEVYHREVKQTCGIERCQARTGRAQRNHILRLGLGNTNCASHKKLPFTNKIGM